MSSSLARNTLASATAGLSVMLGGFLSSVVVARLLGVEAAGVVAFASWAITISLVFVDLGTSGTLARYLPELLARDELAASAGLVRFLFRLTASAALVICGGVLSYAAWLWASRGTASVGIGDYWGDPVFWTLIGVASALQASANFTQGFLKGTQRFDRLARLALASAALQLCATAAGARLWGADGALMGALLVGLLPGLLLPGILSAPGAADPGLRSRARRYTIESWIGYLGSAFAWSRMEIFFLERSTGSHAVALFSVGLTLANMATQGPLLLTGGLLPYLSAQSGLDAQRKLQETYAVATRTLAFLVFPACFGMAAIAPALLPAIYGRDFAGAVPSAAVLVAASAFTATSSVATTYMLALERTRLVLATGGFSAVLVIVNGLTVIPAFGLMGAALARATIQLGAVAAGLWYVNVRLRCATPFSSCARIMLAALICAAAAAGCIRLVPGASGVVLAVAAGVLVYGGAVRLLNALPHSDIERLVASFAILPAAVRTPATLTLRLLSRSDPHARAAA